MHFWGVGGAGVAEMDENIHIYIFGAGGAETNTNKYIVGAGGAETFDNIHISGAGSAEMLGNIFISGAGGAGALQNIHIVGAGGADTQKHTFSAPDKSNILGTECCALLHIRVFRFFCENKKISLVQGAPFENNVPVRIHDFLSQHHRCFT